MEEQFGEGGVDVGDKLGILFAAKERCVYLGKGVF